MADGRSGGGIRGQATPLWRAEDLVRACKGRLDGPSDWSVSSLSIDSRLATSGALFVALKDKRDGHDFVGAAFEAGASAALVSRRPDGVAPDRPLVIVPDPLEALGAMAAARRAQSAARIAAVTGSVGKTGSTEMMRLALGSFGSVHAPAKSFNNHIGVPLTLAGMPLDHAFGVFEIGMNHAGEITPLTRLVRPHTAIVTTVEAVHLENFESVEGIAKAKAEIFLGVEPGGAALINRDNPYADLLDGLAREAGIERRLMFGTAPEAGARLLTVEGDDTHIAFTADIFGVSCGARLPVAGQHHALNAVAVLGAVHALGLDVAPAAEALGAFTAGEGRGARHDLPWSGGAITLLDESYNASPVSVAAALSTLSRTVPGPGGRRIAVLGDMLELGPDSPRFHAEIAEAVVTGEIDLVFCAGPMMRHLFEALPAAHRGHWAPDSRQLAGPLLEAVRPGDVLAVKGSLGSRMRLVVDELLAKRLKHSMDRVDMGGTGPGPQSASIRNGNEGA